MNGVKRSTSLSFPSSDTALEVLIGETEESTKIRTIPVGKEDKIRHHL